MTGIIKVYKTANYVQVSNDAVQKKLKKLHSIGLLTYLISLPETWVIQKTQLMRQFGRAAVTHAFKELEENGFLISIKYRSGSKNLWTYAISDVQFTREQVHEIVLNADFEALEVKNMHEIDLKICTKIRKEMHQEMQQGSENVDIPTFNQVPKINTSDLSSVENQHLKMNCSKSTAIKEITNKKITNKISSSSEENNTSQTLQKRTIEARSKIDTELREKYANVPFDEIKEQLLNDETVVLETSRQYKAMLNYRLKNYKPSKPSTNKPNSTKRYNRKVENVPDWLQVPKTQQATSNGAAVPTNENDAAIDFELEKKKILAKLGKVE